MKNITLRDVKKYVQENGFGLQACHEFKADFMSEGVSYVLRQTKTKNTGMVGEDYGIIFK